MECCGHLVNVWDTVVQKRPETDHGPEGGFCVFHQSDVYACRRSLIAMSLVTDSVETLLKRIVAAVTLLLVQLSSVSSAAWRTTPNYIHGIQSAIILKEAYTFFFWPLCVLR